MRRLAFLLVLLTTPAVAQEHPHAAADPAPAEAIGQVHFRVSCPAVAADFNVATAMLHSFWYEKAETAFAAIAKRDPDCAMAYWGQAMSLWHPLWDRPNANTLTRGRALLAQAAAAREANPRERAFIGALDAFHRGNDVAYPARAQAYEKAMAKLHAAYPGDREVTAFYSLAMLATAQALPPDKTYAREKRAAALLNGVLAAEPRHPGALHYLIHACDSPALAQYGLEAARIYARIAPSVPHALHMPSHIFTRLGLWPESIDSNRAAAAAARRFAVETRLPGAWDEQLHAMDYLEYAYLQRGQDRQARAVLDEMLAIRTASPENFKVANAYAAIPARHAIERRRWAEAAALTVNHPDFPWATFPFAEATTQFARALGGARSGDLDTAHAGVQRLTELEATLKQMHDDYWAIQVEIQRLAASAWLAHAQRHDGEAIRLMRTASDLEDASEKRPVTPGPIVPARELLGDLLLELAQPSAAQHEFEVVLATSPNRFGALVGAARAARQAGNVSRTRGHYTALVHLANQGDDDRPELAEARAWLGRTANGSQGH